MNEPERDRSEDVVLQQIVITRALRSEDGVEYYTCDYHSQASWLEDLALLEAAKWDLHDRCQGIGKYSNDDAD